jgi:hypothetical protein
MVNDTFEECDDPAPLEDRVQEAVAEAFAVADSIHDESKSSSNWNDVCFSDPLNGDVAEDGNDNEEGNNERFDPEALEEAMTGLYNGTKLSTLAATIILQNLSTIHGISNCFVDELFSILYGHLLPQGNKLPRNHYAAKMFTKKLGLAYNTIHSC